VKAHGVKYLAKVFTLPNVQVGSIIEWKYTEYWENYVFAPHWVLQDDLVTKRAKFTFVPMFKAGHYIEDSRGDIKDRVYYSLIGLPENTAVKTVANNRMELELKDIPGFPGRGLCPAIGRVEDAREFYYGTDKMGKPQEFWKSEGKYWNKEVDKFAGHSAAVAAAVGHAISPTDTADQKARKIYAYVQKIRTSPYTSREGAWKNFLAGREPVKAGQLTTFLGKNEGYRDEIARLFGRWQERPIYRHSSCVWRTATSILFQTERSPYPIAAVLTA